MLKISQKIMNLITQFQDTVHDTAIEYHRKVRDKEITKSALDEIKGIGEKKKQNLLLKFGVEQQVEHLLLHQLI